MATLTTKEVAEQVGCSPKTLRKFLRFQAKEAGGEVGVDTPGKGKRYSFEPKEVKSIKKQYADWSAAQAAARAARLAALAEESEVENDESDEEISEEDLVELD
jgi:predicted transcriptional regulator